MSKIRYLKEEYSLDEAQDDLRHDALTLMGFNIAGNFKRCNKRSMTQKDVDNVVRVLYDVLIHENDLKNEWNQTS